LGELDTRGKRALAAEQYDEARAAYEHLLVLAPGNELARKRLERIDAGIYARNRARRRALVRRGSLIMTSVLIIVWSFFEIAARHAAIEASRTVSRLGLIESKNYTSAIDVYRAVVHEYPHTTVAVFELAERLEDLEAKLEGQSAASRSRATRDD